MQKIIAELLTRSIEQTKKEMQERVSAADYRKLVSETGEQQALIDRCNLFAAEYPELALIFAIPNGGERPSRIDKKGRRYSPEAQKLKREGQKAGVPDLQLPVARKGFHSLFIEMKTEKGKASLEQLWWNSELNKQGNHAVFAKGQQAAWELIVWYLDIKE